MFIFAIIFVFNDKTTTKNKKTLQQKHEYVVFAFIFFNLANTKQK